ncbi:MAG: hypothetical protein LBD94_00095 [Rickettsiales bacterium]|jgi:hypothetical protein|nr:hypothetical protein [Rickettsiales bacterium]
MKKTMKTAVALAVLATPAFAANLENPLYLPKAGDVYSKTGVGVMYKIADDTPAQKLKNHDGATEFPIWRLAEDLGYGITDRLAIQGSFGYTYDGDINRKGLHQGRLGAIYRILAETQPFVLDVYADAHIGGLSKMTGRATLHSLTVTSFTFDNYGTGQYGVWGGFRAGKTWDKLTGSVFAEVGHFFANDNSKINVDSTFNPLLVGDAVAKIKAYTDWNIGTKWSYDFAPKWTSGFGFAWKHHSNHVVDSAKSDSALLTSKVIPGFNNKDLKDGFNEFAVSLSVANELSDTVQIALYGEYTFDNGQDGSQNSTDVKAELGVRLNAQF